MMATISRSSPATTNLLFSIMDHLRLFAPAGGVFPDSYQRHLNPAIRLNGREIDPLSINSVYCTNVTAGD
jgi:hypothetical protein